MKLTTKSHMKATKSGMTLLELTVVILVLLSLISILFIGARAWKRGSDRAAAILQIRNSQQAVRSFANMYGKNIGDAVNPGTAATAGDVYGPGKFIERNPTTDVTHPAGTSYAFAYGPQSGAGLVVPAVGDLYIVSAAGTGGTAPTAAEIAEMNPTAGTHGDW